MTMPRVDLYGIIHKTLRTLLFDLSNRLASTNFADVGQRDALIGTLERAMGFISEHGTHEDTFVDPCLKAANAELAAKVETTHQALNRRCDTIAGLAAELKGAEGDAAVGLGAMLHRSYTDFLAAYLTHMASEEGEINDAPWAKYSDDELAQVRTELQGSIPPPRFAEWFALMVPAMNLQERIGVLGGMKMGAPPPVFQAMSGVAKQAIGDEAWAEVAAGLPQG